MVACVLSNPKVANESVAHTFADCGNRRQASRAEPENAIISPAALAAFVSALRSAASPLPPAFAAFPLPLASDESSSRKASSIQGCTRLAAGLRDVISARCIAPASATAFNVSKPPMAPVVM